jgi:tetratricopeptide (TPR) repeat protein
MRLVLVILFFSAFSTFAQSTDERLAAQYFFDKDYTKAADLYEDLARKQPESVYFYENLLQCYVLLKDFKSAEKLLDKRIKKYQFQYAYQVDKAYLYNLQGELTKRDDIFNQLIKMKFATTDEVDLLANGFLKRRFFDQAISTYINARSNLNDQSLFAYSLSELYFQSGKLSEATEELVNIAGNNDYMMDEIKNRLIVAYQKNDQYKLLTNILLLKLQKTPDNIAYNDMLIWSFTQQRDWNGALIQAKAIDKRLKEEGKRVLELTNVLITNEVYDVAVKGFEYIKLLGQDKFYYFQAQQGILSCGMLRVRLENGGTPEQLKALEFEFLNYLNVNGYNWQTAEQMKDLAELYIYHLHQSDKGIEQLNKAISMPGINSRLLAQCKLNLGDAMLIAGDPWEADLLYKQVEKSFTNDAIGQEARFRYARLCYFRGDFEWAQTQLDVLKGATTQLISNNAMRLWLIIQDNLGLDSTDEALKLYASADLLIFQNKPDQALKILDQIPEQFPGHTLTDEILFSKALIYEQKSDYLMAEQLYLRISKDFSFDILADNALINLAKLYEYKLNDTAKAKRIYELIVLNYTGSLYISEARKRFRILRGDGLKEQEVNY